MLPLSAAGSLHRELKKYWMDVKNQIIVFFIFIYLLQFSESRGFKHVVHGPKPARPVSENCRLITGVYELRAVPAVLFSECMQSFVDDEEEIINNQKFVNNHRD